MNQSDLIAVRLTNAAVVSRHDEDFDAFHRDFEHHLKNLTEAMSKSQAISTNAQKIREKGALNMFWGGLNGDNDKQFADMAKDLATSLNTTQVILQMVMKLNHRKNNFLSRFHNALVNKIQNLTNDSQTLDMNQKEATLVILEELDRQVVAQIERHELVYRHEDRLQSIDQELVDVDARADATSARMKSIESLMQRTVEENAKLHQLAEGLHAQTDELALRLCADAKQLDETARRLLAQIERQDAMDIRIAAQIKQQGDLEGSIAELKMLCTQSRERIDRLEDAVAHVTSAKAMLLRNGFSLVALLFSAAALLKILV